MNTLQERRIFFICCLFFCIFFALGGRLAYLQLFKGRQLAAAAVAEHTLRLPVANFFRGDIQDCRGNSLLDGKRVYGVAVFPSLIPCSFGVEVSSSVKQPRWEGVFIEGLINNLPQRCRHQKLRAFLQGSLSKRIPFMLPLTLNEQETKSLADMEMSGVYLVPLPVRYGDTSLARHLVGYVRGVVPGGEMQQGVKGIEAAYDAVLAPSERKLELLTVIDRQGELLKGRGLRLRGPQGMVVKGKNVILTLDSDIQRTVEEIMDKYGARGAVAVIDVATGDVRALASRPLYNQNNGAGDQFDRSLALYHPGSVFKIVVAAAALAEGKVRPNEHFFCSGKYSFNDKEGIACWKKGGHGNLTFREAFAHSCNSVFVDVALRLGGRLLERYARLLGMEGGLDGYLPRQQLGVVRIGSYPGQVGNAALGQDGVLISPLNAAVLAATVARGGIYIPPRVVKAITDADGKTDKLYLSAPSRRVLSPKVARELQKMMELTVTRGTGKRAEVEGIGSAGKTGSAETGIHNAKGDPVADSWFVGYAPSAHPQLAVAVVVEGGGAGGGLAADMFREILKSIYRPGGLERDN